MKTAPDHAVDRKLYRRCEQVLIAHGRLYWRGREGSLKRIVRQYLRPNRNNSAFLRWVLGSKAHVVTVTLLLLTLHAGPVSAFYEGQLGASNPFNGVDVGTFSAPALVDIDNDGDFDAFIGESIGEHQLLENTGSNSNPVFAEQTGASNPFNGVDLGTDSKPAFVDIDNDGDFDAFIGEDDGTINFYENTGTSTSPVFTEQTGASNPFDGVDVGSRSVPAFVDIDNDVDFDTFSGHYDGTISYY